MSEAAAGAVQVLDFMRILYDCGIEVDVDPAALLSVLGAAGIDGIGEDDVDLFLTMGFVLRLLLRRGGLDPDRGFAAVRSDLETLGQLIDDPDRSDPID